MEEQVISPRRIPRQLTDMIFASLCLDDIKNLRCVSRYWKKLIEDEERITFMFPLHEINIHQITPMLIQLTVPPQLTTVIFANLSTFPTSLERVKMGTVIIGESNSDEVFWGVIALLRKNVSCKSLKICITSVPVQSEFALETLHLDFITSLELTILSVQTHRREKYRRDPSADEADTTHLDAFMNLLSRTAIKKLDVLRITLDFEHYWIPVDLTRLFNFVGIQGSNLKHLYLALRVKRTDNIPVQTLPKDWCIEELNLRLEERYIRCIEPLIMSVVNIKKLGICGWSKDYVCGISSIMGRLLAFMKANCAEVTKLSFENFVTTSEDIALLHLPMLVELNIETFYAKGFESEFPITSFPVLRSLNLKLHITIDYNGENIRTMCSHTLRHFRTLAPNLVRVNVSSDVGIRMSDFITCIKENRRIKEFFLAHAKDETWMEIHAYYVHRAPGLYGVLEFENNVKGLRVFVDRNVYK